MLADTAVAIASASASRDFWQSFDDWAEWAVILGAILEVIDLKSVSKVLRLDKRETLKEVIAIAGLVLLILGLFGEEYAGTQVSKQTEMIEAILGDAAARAKRTADAARRSPMVMSPKAALREAPSVYGEARAAFAARRANGSSALSISARRSRGGVGVIAMRPTTFTDLRCASANASLVALSGSPIFPHLQGGQGGTSVLNTRDDGAGAQEPSDATGPIVRGRRRTITFHHSSPSARTGRLGVLGVIEWPRTGRR